MNSIAGHFPTENDRIPVQAAAVCSAERQKKGYPPEQTALPLYFHFSMRFVSTSASYFSTSRYQFSRTGTPMVSQK